MFLMIEMTVYIGVCKRRKHEKLIIINELINTIKQLHNTNHIHGDLKPNNVL